MAQFNQPIPALSSAKVAWHKSLRFRLALAFSLVTLTLVSVVGFAMMGFLLRGMENQFDMRLTDRADTLSVRLSDASAGLGESLVPALDNFSAVLDEQGNVFVMPQNTPCLLHLATLCPSRPRVTSVWATCRCVASPVS
ncbi:hypothetical protein [Deinococcus radiophilus]|uniref:hypothetical protein n=1 Tax=Deinococcus radiophilus TaxID=32062 RepID=UPI0036176D1A